jgi:long-chain acyl-CoA synthetase
MRVEQFLAESAARFTHKTALVAGGPRTTYAELDDRASRLAQGLRARGLRRGERVVLFLGNSTEAVVGLFATLKAGGVFTIVHPSIKADKLAWLIAKYGATALLTETALVAVAREAVARSPLPVRIVAGPKASDGWHAYADLIAASPSQAPAQPGIDVDLAMIVTTSGSTGVPKGVMMTHQNIVAAATSITTYLENVPEDVVLSVLPLSFDYGLYQVLMNVKTGATLVLERSFAFPAAILQKLKDERVTGFPLVPTIAAMLLQRRDIEPGAFPHLRYLTSTAAALPPAHIVRLQQMFPQARMFSMYGLTECKRCTYLPPAELERRPASVGIAIPGTEAYVVDDAGNRVAPGVVGELVIRGAHVFKGYWDNPEETAKKLRPGPYPWESVLYTGDLFKTDEEGFLYFVGRKDDIIKTLGEKVSPKEVETAIYTLQGVREVAVVGVPDAMLGSAIKAIVVADPQAALSGRDVIAHCARRLESYMVPTLVELRDDLPKTANGKIDRKALQEQATERAAETLPA